MEEKVKKNGVGENSEFEKLTVMGDTYYTRYTRKYQKRQPWSKPNPREIFSFIPGTIREILVSEGEHVEAGSKLLVLEAMKMMNSITAPFEGKIRSINVSVGDCVPRGTVMIELD